MILAIDPGSEQSAWMRFDSSGRLAGFAKEANGRVLAMCRDLGPDDHVAIEQIKSYGMAVGAEIFETCVWTGRFMEAASAAQIRRIPRLEVKLHLCHDSRAKDANIRQALIDRFGGPACIRKGGALHGVSGDCWAALAVAMTWWDKYRRIAA